MPASRAIPLPTRFFRALRKKSIVPRLDSINFGDLRRLRPISRKWGFDRGTPIDRYYIESFLDQEKSGICGACLEIGSPDYTIRFGEERVEHADVLHYCEGNSEATIVGDLASLPEVEDDRFDCIICTQTLQFVGDPRAALQTMMRILRPGGVLLLTVPCLSQLDRDPKASWNDLWRFTSAGLRTLFLGLGADKEDLKIHTFGNVLTATSFLQGIASEELSEEELDTSDNMFEVLIGARYAKPQTR